MAGELRAIRDLAGPGAAPVVERVVRLAEVPFRMLRPDPELDFMGPSLADAIAMSLAGIRSLVVRAPLAAATFATGVPDLRELARALDADVALFGTVLQAGGRCRVASQLVDVPGGEVRWSQTTEVSGDDVFEIQDQLARRIVESLQLPLSARERRALGSDVPASATAYEFFLRAQRMLQVTPDVTVARDLYRRAVDEDPRFAPAWVGLGRTLRLMAKFLFETDQAENLRSAEQALARALELHPDMPRAHHIAAHQELDTGRVDAAMERLLGMVTRNPNEPLGFAGLVAAYRYLGLLDHSVAAEARVRALDPRLPTSFLHTLDALGEYERALGETGGTSFSFDRARMLAILERHDEAENAMQNLSGETVEDALGLWRVALQAAMTRDAEAAARVFPRLRHYPDPEGLCSISRCLVRAGDHEHGIALFEACVERGYSNVPLFRRDPWYQPVREHPRFRAALAVAEERHRMAIARYPAPAG